MARHFPLLPDPHPVEPGTHPALQDQLRDGLRQAFPMPSQDNDARFGALLAALAHGKPSAVPPRGSEEAAAW